MTKNGPALLILSIILLLGLLVTPINTLSLQREKDGKSAVNSDIAYVQCRKNAKAYYGQCRTLMIQHAEGITDSNELQKLYKVIPENMKCTYLWMQMKAKCQKDRQNAEKN
uniref:Uncharacterized protein n=1 Tax=Clytia hemisphaerica TaxID=252671 RepID=A0A7M5XA28_9CNID